MLKGVRKAFPVAVFAFVLFAVSALASFSSVFAAETTNTMDYNVYVKPTLSISASTNTMVLNLNPSSKPFDTANLNVTVGTNNLYGYKLFMTTDNDTTYLDRDTSSDGVSANIPTLAVSSATQSSSDLINHWGYRVNNDVGGDSNIIDTTGTNFFPYTPTPTQPLISSATTASNERTASLTFGAKIDFNQPSGTYDLLLKFKALPNVSTNYIQNLDPQLCTEEPLVVIDSRDEQPYTVQRLKDGNCWMMTNLNLQHATNDLTAADTNIAAGTTLSATTFNGWKTNTPTANYTNGEFIPVTSDNSSDGRSIDENSNTPYGTLYNFCAASAGTYCYDGTSGVGDSGQDLCPAGWRLPTGGADGGEFQNLYTTYGSNISKMLAPILDGGLAFALAGVFNIETSSSLVRQGTYGFYWASTRYTSPNMYNLAVTNSSITTNNQGKRYIGRSIRCIRDDRTIAGIQNMQDITSIRVKNTPEGTTATLTDTRETKSYTVAKINGNLWMTKNLSVGCTNNATNPAITSRTLSNTDTNIISASYATTTTTLTSGGNSYDNAYVQCDATHGGYYNFSAATAGTITGSTNSADAIQDVCPKGWKLPTHDQEISISGRASDFNVVTNGGYYNNKTLQHLDNRSFWWTSTHVTDVGVYKISTDATGELTISGGLQRTQGINIRCVAR